MTSEVKELRTIKRASEVTGASERFLKHLIAEGRLIKYKINSATFISLIELESIAKPVKKVTV